ncbi:hypothetical protein [Algibacter sp. L4_22]|uniref:hypothetical protein n=1 Tax=Algibacter sp. L4_22 TaxID=2942477 RepID=UPI00201B4DDA|nr:hypothetical protein [Algibacter sp. L4_22]MCL5128123.1 hypothetical protein [Algibacter sp. L4_22]
MKQVISKTKQVFIVLVTVLAFSCSAEDGAEGPAGADGTDGNANVQVFTFTDFNAEFPTARYDFYLPIASLTTEQNDTVTVLVYLESSLGYIQAPGLGATIDHTIEYFSYLDGATPSINVEFITTSTPLTSYIVEEGTYSKAKIILIEASTVVSGKSNVKDKLAKSGVDYTDYYSVCDYYGLAY